MTEVQDQLAATPGEKSVQGKIYRGPSTRSQVNPGYLHDGQIMFWAGSKMEPEQTVKWKKITKSLNKY